MSIAAILGAIIALAITLHLNKLGVKRGDGPLGGVCDGIASQYNQPANAVRIAWVILSCFGGFGVLLYIFCWIVLKEK